MNIFIFISDSLRKKEAFKTNLPKFSDILFENCWTNGTWTLPAMTTMFTGKVPTIIEEIYSPQPHKIKQEDYDKLQLWKNLTYKYKTVISSPWIFIRNLYELSITKNGSLFYMNNFPFADINSKLIGEGYYQRRISRDNHPQINKLPNPFFIIHHNSLTHSEFGLDRLTFTKNINNKEFLINQAQKQANIVSEYFEQIYQEVPNDTLLIFISDHGEDFNEISKNKECGHATCYTEDVMRVPLFLKYKGKKNIFKNIEKIQKNNISHQDFYNQLCSWTSENPEFILNKENKENIVFSQGSYVDEQSMKFLKDSKVGIINTKENEIYTQSMVTEIEELSSGFNQEKIISYRKKLKELLS